MGRWVGSGRGRSCEVGGMGWDEGAGLRGWWWWERGGPGRIVN